MKFHVLTVFPEFYQPFVEKGQLNQGIKKGHLEINTWDLRQFADGDYGQVDDRAYGGRFGMVMKPEPYFRGVDEIKKQATDPRVLLMAPDGNNLDNQAAKNLSDCDEIIILTGRYEGVDRRVRDHLADEVWSIGPYITPGGDLPALVLMSAVARHVPGVVGNQFSVESDSFQDQMLAPPHYTRPAEYRGHKVPEVLLSGDHGKIEKWRQEKARERTRRNCPELLEENKNNDDQEVSQ
ncbi:MAG: tRNA (guanosine(37)-N1)-methyltransferase TrmD [bacterium]